MPSVKCDHETGDNLTTLVLLILLFAIGFLIAAVAPAVMYDLWTSFR